MEGSALLLPDFFGWEGEPPTQIDNRTKKRYPYSNLSTGGPRLGF